MMSKQELIDYLEPEYTYAVIAANMLDISLSSLYKLSYKHDICFPRAPHGFNKLYTDWLVAQKTENIRFRERNKK